MDWLDLTMETPEENLACDEALLEDCESGGPEVLRCWESARHFVVVGHGGRISREAGLAACARDGVPVLRRCSGGGTVLQGPGCLNYALVLRIPESGPLASIPGATRHVMEAHRALAEGLLGRAVEVRGVSDLVVEGRKFSGNAQRRKRRALLFHGTWMLGMDPALITRYLVMPERQPEYREQRSHEEFVTRLGLPAQAVKARLRQRWAASQARAGAPAALVAALVRDKYSRPEWTWKHEPARETSEFCNPLGG